MQRSRVISVCLFASFVSVSFAQRDEAIIELLKPIVAKIAASPNVGGWTWETNGNGGYLVKKSMDVTDDGRPELFVASTLESTKHDQIWTVFDIAKDGTLRPYRTTLQHSSAWPIVEGDKTQLIYVLPSSSERMRENDEKPYPVYRYAFKFPEIKEFLSYGSEAEIAKISQSASNKLPKLEAILLAEYLTNPDAQWADVTEWRKDPNDCYFRPEDTEKLKIYSNFKPEQAMQLLGNSARPDRRSRQMPTNGLSAAIPRLLPANMPDKAQHTESSQSLTKWPWIVGAVALILAAVVMLKRR